jgi:hypothetical protein
LARPAPRASLLVFLPPADMYEREDVPHHAGIDRAEPTMSDLHGIASAVIRRAQRQGYVVPREIRAELAAAGLPEDRWKEVVALARDSLGLRSGRYYHINPLPARPHPQEQQREAIRDAVGQLLARHREKAARDDRRREDRVDFLHPVTAHAEDGRELHLLSRDLSPAGIRLIGTRSLLGQKVRVLLPQAEGAEPCAFLVRILWTAAVGDDLFENGGTFLERA